MDQELRQQESGGILSGQEVDTIGEVLNISMGSAATAISTMLDQKVVISTPKVEVRGFSSRDYSAMEPTMLVKIEYVEGLFGSNLMIFRQRDMQVILGLLMGDSTPPSADFVFDELSTSAACEVMNQMMGASATALSEFLNRVVNISTPVATAEEDKSAFFAATGVKEGEQVVYVSFRLTIDGVMDSDFVSVLSLELAKDITGQLVEEQAMAAQEIAGAKEARAPAAPPQMPPAAQAPPAPPVTPPPAAPQPDPLEDLPIGDDGPIGAMPPPVMPPPTAPQPAPGPFGDLPLGDDGPIEDPTMMGAPAPQPDISAAASAPPVYAPPQQSQPAAPPPTMAPGGAPGYTTAPGPSYGAPATPPEEANYQMPPTVKPPEQPVSVQSPQFPQFAPQQTKSPATGTNMDLLMRVSLDVSVEIGKAKRKIKDILDFGQGTVIELNKQAGAPVDIVVNGCLLARGDVVVIDDNFGVRITEIVGAKELMESLKEENGL